MLRKKLIFLFMFSICGLSYGQTINDIINAHPSNRESLLNSSPNFLAAGGGIYSEYYAPDFIGNSGGYTPRFRKFNKDVDNDGFGNENNYVYFLIDSNQAVTNTIAIESGVSELYNYNTSLTIYDDDLNSYNIVKRSYAVSFEGSSWVLNSYGSDCDDNNSTIPNGLQMTYKDSDGDGYGAEFPRFVSGIGCIPNGYIGNKRDCNDSNATVTTNPATWYRDFDQDGFGDPSDTQVSCGQPNGYVSNDNDCDDANPKYNNENIIWYADFDGDGFGDKNNTITASCPPANYVTDCYFDECPTEKGTRKNGCPQIGYDFNNENKNYSYQRTYLEEFEADELANVKVNQVQEAISYKDGLGRAKQDIIIRGGGQSFSEANVVPYDWTEGNTGATDFFNQNGYNYESGIISGLTPFGNNDLLWECRPDTSNNADGGWNTDYFSIDNNKSYRYTIWVKKTGSVTNPTSGRTDHGIQNVNNLDGSFNSNPYFFYSFLPEVDTWYLLVGVVHPKDYQGGDTNLSGLYDVDGNKVMDGAEFKWSANHTNTRLRNFLNYCTDTNVHQYFWSPLFQVLDGNELTLDDVLTTNSVIINGVNSNDIIKHYEYDDNGKMTKDYLAYATNSQSGIYDVNSKVNTLNFYNSSEYENTTNPYSEVITEDSPLNRVLKEGSPGSSWLIDPTSDDDHTIKSEYKTNSNLDQVRKFNVSFINGEIEQPQLQENSNYSANRLNKFISKDENWSPNQTYTKDNTKEVYKNEKGLVILKREFEEDERFDTYYIYDNFDNLSFVLSPEASDNTVITTSILDNLSHQYKYDYKNRLVERKIPGKDWEYIIYDSLDRPVLTQDGLLRVNNQWVYSKFDAFGRVAYTGKYNDVRSRTSLQQAINNEENYFENRTTSPNLNGVIYYNNQASPIGILDSDLLTINYYDAYDNILPSSLTNQITNSYGITSTDNTRGLATVTKSKVLDEPFWITTVIYYDNDSRPIYIHKSNPYLEVVDIVEFKYSFTGNILEKNTIHQKTNQLEIKTIDKFEYDHQSRLISETQKINNQITEIISRNNYDELGQLKSKLVGNGTKQGYKDVTYGIKVEDDVITKIGGASWSAGLATLGSFDADGYVSFSPTQQNRYYMVGLSDVNSDAHYSTIDYAIYLVHTSNIYVFESGVSKGRKTGYEIGDVFKVERIGTEIHYKKNGETFYISETPSSGTLLGDISMVHTGAKIKDFHIVDNSKGLQKVDYNYNIRGWLKNINEDTNDDNDLFNFTLRYNDATDSSKALFNGNISQTNWNSLSPNPVNSPISNQYTYEYDALNRIIKASDNTGIYNVANISYDKNGNLLSLKRTGAIDASNSNYGFIDDLSYSYVNGTNKLRDVEDATVHDLGFKDDDDATNVDDYQYDSNGNMISDANKQITSIVYNYLNLPKQITINGKNINYTYDATGVKLSKSVNHGSEDEITQYSDKFIYKRTASSGAQNILQFFNHSEGYVKNDMGVFNYVYQYKDHLGSVRLTYSDKNKDGEVNGSKTQVFNDGFENTNDWSTTSGQSYGGSPLSAFDTSVKHSGEYSGRIDSNYPANWERYVFSNKVISIDNAVNTDYIISGWLFLENVPGNQAQIFLTMRNHGATGYPSNFSNITTTTKGSWVYVEKRVTVPSSVGELIFRIDNDKAGKVWFDDLKIERANDINDIEIVNEFNYYPFGLKHEGYNSVFSPNANSTANKIGFNGIEYEQVHGLNLYEMDWRSYDPAIARWTSIDPVIHFSMSPYVAFDNNPIFWSDPSGADAESNDPDPEIDGGTLDEIVITAKTNNRTGYEPTMEDWDMLDLLERELPSVYASIRARYDNGDYYKLTGGGDWGDFEQQFSLGWLGRDNYAHTGLAEFWSSFSFYSIVGTMALGTGSSVGITSGLTYGLSESSIQAYNYFVGSYSSAPAMSVGNGQGNYVTGMKIVREIRHGEKITDLISLAQNRTFTTGVEHAVVRLGPNSVAPGIRVLVSGGQHGISFNPGQISTLFGHTHPFVTGASAGDFQALSILNQSKQYIIEGFNPPFSIYLK